VQSDATRTCELLVGLRDVACSASTRGSGSPLRSASTLSTLDPSLYGDPRKFRCPTLTPSHQVSVPPMCR
jgi:hypothetical protein